MKSTKWRKWRLSKYRFPTYIVKGSKPGDGELVIGRVAASYELSKSLGRARVDAMKTTDTSDSSESYYSSKQSPSMDTRTHCGLARNGRRKAGVRHANRERRSDNTFAHRGRTVERIIMGKKRMSSELTIMSLWPTLSDEGKRIIGDWVHSQRAKGDTVKPPRKLRSDAGNTRGSKTSGDDNAN